MSLNEKFRPYFTASELLTVIAALKSHTPYPAQLVRYLETFAIKIERGVVIPAHTVQPSIEQKLGLAAPDNPPTSVNLSVLVTNYEMFPADRHKLTPRQLEAVQQYRFENDRMSPQEERDYVSSLPSGTEK